jgi:multidrug efflux system membrane fusion protein
LESTTAAVSSAKAQISDAQIALDYCFLRAPFDAWIVNRSVDIGSLVSPATKGFSISDTRSVKAVFGVPDIFMRLVKLGQRITIQTDALPQPFIGRVTSISPAADPKSRVYSIEVTIPNHRDLLKAGMIASLALGAELANPTPAVPMSSLIHDPARGSGFAIMIAEGSGDTATARLRR